MNLEQSKIWIKQQEFVYAKSYAQTLPHHYTTRDRCNEQKFEAFIKLIRQHGKIKAFYKKQYLYLELDEYEYWEMGRPLKAVQVLNRALINDKANYRKPVLKQDEEILKEKLSKRDNYLESLLCKSNKTDKDNQQINFLMNSERRIHGGGKNIIDHSTIEVRYE